MKNPPCICIDVFCDASMGSMDRETWLVEYEQYVLHGHVASCHHRSSTPGDVDGAIVAREHRIFARLLNDMMQSAPIERIGRLGRLELGGGSDELAQA